MKTLKAVAPQLVLLLGYFLVCIAAGLVDVRLMLAAMGLIAIYEAREAER